MRNFFTFKQHGKGLNITKGLLYVIFYRFFFLSLGFFSPKVTIYVEIEVSQGSYGRVSYWSLFEELTLTTCSTCYHLLGNKFSSGFSVMSKEEKMSFEKGQFNHIYLFKTIFKIILWKQKLRTGFGWDSDLNDLFFNLSWRVSVSFLDPSYD